MKYVILVSHGEFAPGLKNALGMLAGPKDNLIACGLKDGWSAEQFGEAFAEATSQLAPEDEVILFGDLIGGSPLTTACSNLAERGLTKNTRVIGGMNLPAVLTVLLSADFADLEGLKEMGLSEGRNALNEFSIAADEDEEEDL